MQLSPDHVVTVVHEGRTYVAGIWRYNEVLWHWYALWPLADVEGKIRESDEEITWTRRRLLWWWPFHRSAIKGLLTAAALAPPTQKPRRSGGLKMNKRAKTIHAALRSDFDSLNKDINKIFKDLDKTISDALKFR